MKTQYIVLGIIGILVVGGGFLFVKNQSTPKDSLSAQNTSAKQEEIKTRYLDYSEENFANAVEANNRPVLWFAALAWCSSCQAADRDFKAHFDKVPNDITIMKIDYDTEKQLKQKYAIVMQDTFVQVDSQGKEITRWNSGGQGIEALLANIK